MKRMLVTGGSGFIGTNLIEKFKSEFLILNVDIAEPKISEHNIFHKKIDICDFEAFNQSVQVFQPDFIIHLAARTDLNGKNLKEYQANTLGVRNLLRINESLSNLERVIFASSMYVCYPGYIPENYTDYKPHTVYGESKVLTEQSIIKHENKPYTWSIIRPTSIWGEYFAEPYLYFFKVILKKKYFHFGKRSCNKTYGYIENTLFQIQSILESNKEVIHQKTFYLGDYVPYNISEWADEIADHSSVKIPTYPYIVFFTAAKFGDFLKSMNVRFPITSFRLKNMTTDNVIDLSDIRKISPLLPATRKEGTIKVLKWINLTENQKKS